MLPRQRQSTSAPARRLAPVVWTLAAALLLSSWLLASHEHSIEHEDTPHCVLCLVADRDTAVPAPSESPAPVPLTADGPTPMVARATPIARRPTSTQPRAPPHLI